MILNCRTSFLFLLFKIAGITLTNGNAQTQEIKSLGVPQITNYEPSDYDFDNNNFSVLSGQEGRMYFGNYDGVLIYDGTTWSKITLPNGAPVYGLAQTKDGRIYVGSTNEMGYLEPNKKGDLIYHSLMDKFPEYALMSFTTAPTIFDNGKIIFACSYFMVVIETSELDEPELQVFTGPWSPEDFSDYSSHTAGDDFFVVKQDTLFRFDDQEWTAVRKTNVLSDRYGHGQLIDINNEQTLAITQDGFFDFESEEKIFSDSRTDLFLSDAVIYDLILLQDRYIAISTSKGLLITDLTGIPISLLDKSRGLSDNSLFGSALDPSGMLWVATYSGIDKVDIFSPYTFIDEKMEVESEISDAVLFNDHLFIATESGVMTMEWANMFDPMVLPEFQYVTHTNSHGFISSEDDLIVLTGFGPNLYLDQGELLEIADTDDGSYMFGFFSKTSKDLFLGSWLGRMIHLTKNEKGWSVQSNLDPQFLAAQFMTEGENNDIWVGCDQEGVFKVNYDREYRKILAEKKYGEGDGLPSDYTNYVFEIDNEPIVSTEGGIYRYDESLDRFVQDERFIDLIGKKSIVPFTQSLNGDLFYYAESLFRLRKEGDSWEKVKLPGLNFRKYEPMSIKVVDSANVLIATTSGVVHLDPRNVKPQVPMGLAITSILDIQYGDSSYYEGFGLLPKHFNFSSNQNNLRMSFSALDYVDEIKNRYQLRLLGFDDTWSDWSLEHSKDYTNLSHGNYTFEVKSMNINGAESLVSSVQFTIATPWYYSIWAYILYGIGFFLIVWAIVKGYTRRLINEKNKLELIVVDRTKEISLQKEKVERDSVTISEQHTKLLQMDELKDRFFLNISHELRTPLTLIKGTMHNTLTGKYGSLNERQSASLEISLQNSNRLINMVNNILDISKLELGKIDLNIEKCKPSSILSKVIAFFASRFTDNNISFKSSFDSDVELYLDTEKFETIFINLIANALKFTPSGGLVAISVTEEDNALNFFVKDSGVGIPENEIGYVFDRFYQSAHGKSGEGVGVGLALTKELVELHKGHISVKNNDVEGIEFRISFLKGKEHLSPDQIVNETVKTPKKTIRERYPLADKPVTVGKEFTPNNEKRISDASPHVLLVEDNHEMSTFITELLSENYQVSLAENGQEGIDFLKENKPDLILTDYLMPVMNGYEMAVEIKKTDSLAYIPMMFLTARNQESDKIDVLNLGVDDYLLKPFNNDELLIRINNLLHNKTQRDEFLNQEPIDPQEIDWKEFNSKLKIDLDNYIKEHITEEITVEALTDFTANSDRSLFRKVKANTGLSLMQYIKEYRLRKARTLLENKEVQSVSEASYAVGFNYLSHFTKNYKERFGKNPSEYLD